MDSQTGEWQYLGKIRKRKFIGLHGSWGWINHDLFYFFFDRLALDF